MSKKRRSSKLRSAAPAPSIRREGTGKLAVELSKLNQLLKEERVEKALAKSRELIAGHPEHAGVAKLHGWALLKQEAFAEAQPYFELALIQTPNDPALTLALARCLLAAEEPKKALTLIERVLATQPKRVDALSLRGSAQRALQRISEAIESYRQALEIDPGHLSTHLNLAHLTRYQPGDKVYEALKKRYEDPAESPRVS